MAKKTKAAAAAALSITVDCERDADGFGALTCLGIDPGNFVERSEISALKAKLLAAGFESLECSAHGDISDWNPRDTDEVVIDAPWVLAAVLALGGEHEGESVAVFARPAGMADAPTQAWPFPKTEGGGPDVHSEPACTDSQTASDAVEKPEVEPAPAMSKSEAHLQRKSALFELLEPTDALLKTFTPRVEKHGEDDVSAASLGLQIEAPNTILDLLAPSLRPTLYAAPEGQVTLPGVEESTPLLRTKVIETLKLSNCYEGWTLGISSGLGEIVIGDCKVDKFVVTPRDGGSVTLDLRVGSSDISEEEAGWLYGRLRHEIEITLHAPEVKPESIDGTVGHPGLAGAEKDATDLFMQENGIGVDDEGRMGEGAGAEEDAPAEEGVE